MNIRQLVPPSDQAAHVGRIDADLPGKPARVCRNPERRQRRPAAGRLAYTTPLLDENGDRARPGHDRTRHSRRKKTENELRQLNEELEQRVGRRTAQLTAANEKLMAEIAKHKLAEAASAKTKNAWPRS